MAQITNCLKLISRINEGDQDSLISRIDELQALGVPAQRAQVQAAIDVLARLQREATGIQRSAKRDITETPEFKAWFGDSKVVDADGKPLVVYHGTGRDVSAFDRSKNRISDRRGIPGRRVLFHRLQAGGISIRERRWRKCYSGVPEHQKPVLRRRTAARLHGRAVPTGRRV